MRVSVVNFCSSRADMLDFSSKMLLENAGTNNFDYIVITWNASSDVTEWLRQHTNVKHYIYTTDQSLDYVPNLRAMMNLGFDRGYMLNDWVCIVNTDMAFGKGWLKALMDRAAEDVIPNSLHIAPIKGSNILTADLGVPTEETFQVEKFWKLHDKLYKNAVETEEERGGWEATQTLPYVLHRKWWEDCGPWETKMGDNGPPPDRRFFQRCHDAGTRYVLCRDSICYHHEAVERRSARPLGIENMEEGR